MNATKKKLMIYLPAGVLGLWAMWLQSGILSTGFDENGLMIPDNPALWLVWGLTAVYAVLSLGVTFTLGDSGTYEQNFPRCVLCGSVTLLAGLLLCFSGVNQLVPNRMIQAVLAIAAGILIVLCGLCRMVGRKPPFCLDLLISLFFAAHLLWSYREWNADPHIQRYAFRLLAGAAVMLFTIFRGRCAVGVMERRKLVFAGLMGMFFSFAAIPGGEELLFFLGSGFWCAGAMCDLSRLEKPAETEEENE